MPRYSGESGSSQVIRPGWGQDQWGVRMQEAQQRRLQQIAMKLAMANAGEGGEGDISAEGNEEITDLLAESPAGRAVTEEEDLFENGEFGEDDFLSAEGMGRTSPFEEEFNDPNEVTVDDIGEASYDFMQDDPSTQESEAFQRKVQSDLEGYTYGEGNPVPPEVLQGWAEGAKDWQASDSDFGTGINRKQLTPTQRIMAQRLMAQQQGVPMDPMYRGVAAGQGGLYGATGRQSRMRFPGGGGGGSRYRGY